MKSKGSLLLPVLRSRVQGDILATLFLDPEHSYSLTELAERAGASVRAVHAEANRLVAAGWVTEDRVGRNRMLRANSDTVIARPLTDLLAVSYGPLPVLADALRGAAGVDRAFIYGSWAACYEGLPGAVPGDVDVIVIGDADQDALADAVEPAAVTLRREVNVHRVRAQRWAEPAGDPFLVAIKAKPLVEIPLKGERT